MAMEVGGAAAVLIVGRLQNVEWKWEWCLVGCCCWRGVWSRFVKLATAIDHGMGGD